MSQTVEHKPFIPASQSPHELTALAVIMGAVLGIVFGASSLYLVLKVGVTVSASIPVAVLSITLFRALSNAFGLRQATILENNIVQTTGSAGESIAFGIGVTMPALLILGFDVELSRIMTVAILGGILGVLMMIPMRYALIVKEHGTLTYPEGTACAEVLIVGEKGGTSAKTVFSGFFVGLIYKILNTGLHLWNDVPERALSWFKGASVAGEISPELMGVGYIIGPKISCVMAAGGVLSSWVLIPAIKLFGDGLATPLYPATELISKMSIHDVWRNYVLYIGAGAVTAGGIISLAQGLPTILHGAKAGLAGLSASGRKATSTLRTERDISMKWVIGGCILLVFAIWASPSLKMNLLGALLIVSFGFLFVTVSSRLTGTVGSSSNPISGMTVATLLLTSLIFLLLGWVGADYRVTALSVAAIVCVASSNGGTTSQDLKTGYLIGATPRAQQIAILVGAVTSALVIGMTLHLLNQASTVYSRKNLPTARVDVTKLTRMERVGGSEGERDQALYHVLQFSESDRVGSLVNIPAGKYLVDDKGRVAYLVDPGVNGSLDHRDNGTKVTKFVVPKARLMSLIIDGILTQKLPWGLVLLGVAIALVLELCQVPSLPFAVGVYLPLSASSPIFIGGVVRWLAERGSKKSAAESESSPGVLLSSGLIAGGTIGGTLMAMVVLVPHGEQFVEWLDLSKSFPLSTSESWGDLWAVVPFALMCFHLFAVGRDRRATRKK